MTSGDELAYEPVAAPDRRRHVARPVVELNGETRRTSAHRASYRLCLDHPSDNRGLLSHPQVGDPLYVREVLVARGIVRDEVCQRTNPQLFERSLDTGTYARQFGNGPRPELGKGGAAVEEPGVRRGLLIGRPGHTLPDRRDSRRRRR